LTEQEHEREFDLVVYGASGFTGRLVAEYLVSEYGDDQTLKWAMAGRSGDKLRAVRDEIGAPALTPLVVADVSNPDELDAMVKRTKIVATTVGPYQKYGSDLVGACARHGTDYVDLCGEPGWMREMIDAHEEQAIQSNARIVFSCGFDSVPLDLGTLFLQNAAKARFGGPCSSVKARVRRTKGTFSGGTAASLNATAAAANQNPKLHALLGSAFALTPGFTGPDQPDDTKPIYDPEEGVWLAPFIMATINSKNVHRSNLLLGHPYGEDFIYSEMMMAGPGEKGEAIANAIAQDDSMSRDDAPKPGEGPSREEREAGFFNLLFVGRTKSGEEIRVGVTDDKDPGYGSTSQMIAESALCLLRDRKEVPGGIWTPAAALGEALIDRLEKHTGQSYQIES